MEPSSALRCAHKFPRAATPDGTRALLTRRVDEPGRALDTGWQRRVDRSSSRERREVGRGVAGSHASHRAGEQAGRRWRA